MPGGTYFLYTPAPKTATGGRTFENAEAASQYLITEHSIVTVPWDDAGPFLRFSVTYEAADEQAEDALMAEAETPPRAAGIGFEPANNGERRQQRTTSSGGVSLLFLPGLEESSTQRPDFSQARLRKQWADAHRSPIG
ncbi:MAG: hypothetical protein U0935_16195 [Pirellulales bacterium]